MKIVRLPAGTSALVQWRNGGNDKLREEGRCRMCERASSVRRLTRHHVTPQRWFNRRKFYAVKLIDMYEVGARELLRHVVRDCDLNIVPLCAPCHSAVEHDVIARRMLRKVLAAPEAALVIKLRGQIWFDRTYPPSPSPSPAAQRIAA